MKYSVCIPNYNYEKYIARTVRSVLDQSHRDLEVLISDNASTDGSVAAVKALGDERVRVTVNTRNVGFAPNIDRSVRMATGDVVTVLSSDDLVRPGALAFYERLYAALGGRWERTILTTTTEVIDPDDKPTGRAGPDARLWPASAVDETLSKTLGVTVYSRPAKDLLRDSVLWMKNPFNFASTAYSRRVYEEVEGYGGGRLINPDKWFHWKALSRCELALWIDEPWFAYRWHPANQTAQQAASGALKYLVDEYVSTLELDDATLKTLGLTREQAVQAFVEHDIGRHGLATLAKGNRERAQRILRFGDSVYPAATRRSKSAWTLRALIALGPVGARMAARAYTLYRGAAEGPTG
jgi:glycosyltransferase involved in cell wall biosynthesis